MDIALIHRMLDEVFDRASSATAAIRYATVPPWRPP